MGTRDPRIEAHIATSADFTKPILTPIRAVVHAAGPEVDETTKWGAPHFDSKGEMIADENKAAAGQRGRLTEVSDLPSKQTPTGYIKTAMTLIDAGVKTPRRKAPKAGEAAARRLATAAEWIGEGKRRNWKYQK